VYAGKVFSFPEMFLKVQEINQYLQLHKLQDRQGRVLHAAFTFLSDFWSNKKISMAYFVYRVRT